SHVASAALARALSEDEPAVARALERLRGAEQVAAPVEGRWLTQSRWDAALATVRAEGSDYGAAHPARFGIPKGGLKSVLQSRIDGALFDAAFDRLAAGGELEVRAERVRIAGAPWDPPPAAARALERLEDELEATGFAVPENAQWQVRLGREAPEVMAL